MKKYEVTGTVPGIGTKSGKVQHVIRATSDDEAEARFRRAHPGEAVRITDVRRLGDGKG